MSFIFYDLTFLVIFTLVIIIFLYIKRKNLKREGILYLYKTKIGMNIIDKIAKKYPRTLKVLSYVIIFFGYILMIGSVWLIGYILYIFTKPELIKIIKIPPITPIIPYLPEIFKLDYLPNFPFTYWIIIIALVAIFHEGFHGIFARFYNIKIKSTGFGFLGPLLAFFVEQDKKSMEKAKPFSQQAVLAAGVFANLLLTLIFIILMIVFLNAAYIPSGVQFNTYTYSIVSLDSLELTNQTFTNPLNQTYTVVTSDGKNYFADFRILNYSLSKNLKYTVLYQDQPAIFYGIEGAVTKIENNTINNRNDLDLILRKMKPGEQVVITTEILNSSKYEERKYYIALGADYVNESRAVIGIAFVQPSTSGLKGIIYKTVTYFREPYTFYKEKINIDLSNFIYYLLWWLIVINLGVALANMMPAGIFDGGRFFYLSVLIATKNKKFAESASKWATKIIIAIFVLLIVLWAFAMFR